MPVPFSMNGWLGWAVSVTEPPVVSLTCRMWPLLLTIVPSLKVIVGSPPSTRTEPFDIVQSWVVVPEVTILPILTFWKSALPVASVTTMPCVGPL